LGLVSVTTKIKPNTRPRPWAPVRTNLLLVEYPNSAELEPSASVGPLDSGAVRDLSRNPARGVTMNEAHLDQREIRAWVFKELGSRGCVLETLSNVPLSSLAGVVAGSVIGEEDSHQTDGLGQRWVCWTNDV